MTCANPRPARGTPPDEHRLVLRHYLSFGLEDALRRSGGASLAALRGAGAFLASTLATLAGREERELRDGCAREAAAFEHGFLRMELEAYSREVAELEAAAREGSKAALDSARRCVLRRIHRLEAVLHMHADASADREAG